ncbi:MAG: hypothetical protein IKW39_04225 [Alphaproteobacteria bacterium]|nr:hypothetical protein [Alphaproteobacteria bacterium]
MSFVFNDAKKIYEEISLICLKKSFENDEKDSFKVYDSILNRCNTVLMNATNKEDDVDEEESEEIRVLNRAIYNAYFDSKDRYGEVVRDTKERCFLQGWKSNGNAYDDLKKFALESQGEQKLDYDAVVRLFFQLKEVLNKDISLSLLKKEVDSIFSSYVGFLD